jgi:argininosuccinate lyase
LFDLLIFLSDKHKDALLPGYTHFQLAMPSSFGLWFGAYAESLIDDMEQLFAAFQVTNKNPLGSAAGYGSSFPLNRKMTTELLGFKTLNFNSVYAQMSRIKADRILANAIAAIAGTLSKLSYDVCLFLNQNFAFISFPEQLTTGSSIMPHKKNPDVFELIRANCNRLQALPNEITLLTNNLPVGYHRDLQLLKECIFPSIKTINECLKMTNFMLKNIEIKDNIMDDPKYDLLFSVEAVNKEVLNGLPFRDAYRLISNQIAEGKFKRPETTYYSHEGSIGNLCNSEISKQMEIAIARFDFEKINDRLKSLLSN